MFRCINPNLRAHCGFLLIAFEVERSTSTTTFSHVITLFARTRIFTSGIVYADEESDWNVNEH